MAGKLYGWGNNYDGGLAIDNIFSDKSSPVQTIAGGTNWSKVASNFIGYFSAGIKTDGTLWIWGANDFGQIGNNNTVKIISPIQTITGGANWSEVSLGNRFVGAIKTDGTLWTWGLNSYGQLGDDTTTSKSSPIQTVAFGSNWSKISCGYYHAAAIKTDGTLWLWGDNSYGQIGTDSTIATSSPVQTITGGINWSKVSCGKKITAAIKNDGTLWAWGLNGYGQLGDNTITDKSSPVQIIPGTTDWSQVSLSDGFGGAIKTDGTLWMWGDNYKGNLGNDSIDSVSSPVQTIAGGTNWNSIACASRNTLATKSDNTLWTWGANYFGGLGNNSTVHVSSPVQTITYATNWSTNIAGGYLFGSAIKTDGTLWMWGSNYDAQLGINEIGTVTKRSSPVQEITYSSNWSVVSAKHGSAGIKTDGTLWTWSTGNYGELGNNTALNNPISSPVQTIAGGNDWSSVAVGFGYKAAIKTDGTLWLWGRNFDGQLGDNTEGYSNSKSSPVQTITGGTDWTYVDCGVEHTAAIKTDGTLWLWGSNYYGQLGDGQGYGGNKSSPVQTIAGGTNWSHVACGDYHTGAVKTDGTLWVWGSNSTGQLGDDSTVSKSSPVQTIAGGTDWSHVACGYSSTGAIKKDGTLWMWGFNTYGNVGDDTTVDKSSPVQTITGGTNWLSLKVDGTYNAYATVALKTDGTLWTWGWNSFGGLGDNTTTNKSSPVQTIAGGNSWQEITVGESYVLAIGNLSGPATQLDINTEPNYAFTGRPLGIQPIISATDGASPDPNFSGTITVSVVSGTPTLSGTLSVNAINGTATFSGLILNGLGEVGLGFTASGLTSAYSNLFTVQQDAAIIPKRSEVAGSVPTSGQLQVGEFAINLADKKGYVKKTDGTIVNVFTGLQSGSVTSGMLGTGVVQAGNIASGAVITSAAGNQGNLQYNRSGSFGATSGLVYTTSGTQLSLTSVNTVNVALGLQTLSGNTGNMMEMKPFSGNPSAYFNASGYLYAAGVDGGLF